MFAILDNFNWFLHQFSGKKWKTKKTHIKKILGSKKTPRPKKSISSKKNYLDQKISFSRFMMLEQIYYKEINLDGEGNFTMNITKNNAVNKKSFGR